MLTITFVTRADIHPVTDWGKPTEELTLDNFLINPERMQSDKIIFCEGTKHKKRLK